MFERTEREHAYYAQASLFTAALRTPIKRDIDPLAVITLSEKGGYEAKPQGDFEIAEVVSFTSGYTQLAGFDATFPCEGMVTLATSVVEGLNILDVITVDRVVAQVRTIHPLTGHVPTVTFLGTRFENLRIAGHPVNLDLDLDLCGGKPGDDALYTRDAGFLGRVARQYERLGMDQDLPAEVAERYNQLPLSSEDRETVECSLVNQAEGSYSGHSVGHVIRIPHFGTLSLANLRLEHTNCEREPGIHLKTYFSLTMIDLKLNCTGDGTIRVCEFISNGGGKG